MTGLVVVTPASRPAVTLQEAKDHLRVDVSDEDALIAAFVGAATGYAERFMGRTLVDTTFDLVLDQFPKGRAPLVLPRPPLIEVLGIWVTGSDETETELEGYIVDTASAPARILAPSSGWPSGTSEASIRIRFRAGYVRVDSGSPECVTGEVPRDIWAAMLLYVGSLYLQRESLTPGQMAVVPWGAEQLLRMHRIELAIA
jgi:uncharacterized phiE125 gp8 family phage protein